MEYEQALIIGKRRRADAAVALSSYVRERAAEVCAVKPSKDSGLDAREWEPVGEENFKEICIRTESGRRPGSVPAGGGWNGVRKGLHAADISAADRPADGLGDPAAGLRRP